MLSKSLLQKSTRAFSSNAYHKALNEKYVCHNYAPYPVAIEKAERIYVYDIEGNRYMDWMSGFGSTNQGHCHPEIIKALVE